MSSHYISGISIRWHHTVNAFDLAANLENSGVEITDIWNITLGVVYGHITN